MLSQATAVIISTPKPVPPPPPPDQHVELKLTMHEASLLKSLLGKYCSKGMKREHDTQLIFDALSRAGVPHLESLSYLVPVQAVYNGSGWTWGDVK